MLLAQAAVVVALGVALVCWSLWGVYFRADPLTSRGWILFLAFLLSMGVFMKGIGLMLDWDEQRIVRLSQNH